MPDTLPQFESEISDHEAAILAQYGQLAEKISEFFAELNLRAIPGWTCDGVGSCGGYHPGIEIVEALERTRNKKYADCFARPALAAACPSPGQ